MEPRTAPDQKTLTLALIKENSMGQMHADIKFAETFFPAYPHAPAKPYLKRDASSSEAKQYALALEAWEKDHADYKRSLNEYIKKRDLIESVIIKYIKEESGFNKLPEKSKEKVWQKAWDEGHSSGYLSIYHHLVELVDLF